MIIEFFGMRGSGKTTAMRAQIPNCKPPVMVIDLLGNFQDVGYQTTSLSDALLKMAEFLKTRDEKLKIITLQTSAPDEAIDYLCAALWQAHGGTLVLDEVDGFSMADAPSFDDAIRYGRNRGIDIITGCRRPAEISKHITAAANKVYCFVTHEPRDVEYFSRTVFGKEAERLMGLDHYHGLYIDYDKKELGEFRTDQTGRIFQKRTKSLIHGKSLDNSETQDDELTENDSETEDQVITD